MIEVIYTPETVEMRGHATGAGKVNGTNPICEAATCLSYTLLNSILYLTGDKPASEIKPGLFFLRTEKLDQRARLILDTFKIGIDILCENYPEYIRIINS